MQFYDFLNEIFLIKVREFNVSISPDVGHFGIPLLFQVIVTNWSYYYGTHNIIYPGLEYYWGSWTYLHLKYAFNTIEPAQYRKSISTGSPFTVEKLDILWPMEFEDVYWVIGA